MNKYIVVIMYSVYAICIQAMEKRQLTISPQQSLPVLLQALDEASLCLNYTNNNQAALNRYEDRKKEYYNVITNYNNCPSYRMSEYVIHTKIDGDSYKDTLRMLRPCIQTLLFLSDSIKGDYIQTVHVPYNQLTDLPLGFLLQKMPNLEDLNVSHNAISYVSTAEIPTSKLHTCNISYNQLSELDLQKFLDTNNAIESLDLSNNPLHTIKLNNFPQHFGERNPVINLISTNLSKETIATIGKKYAQCIHKTNFGKNVDMGITFMTCTVAATLMHAFAHYSNSGYDMEALLTYPAIIGINKLHQCMPTESIKNRIYPYLEEQCEKEINTLASKQKNILF